MVSAEIVVRFELKTAEMQSCIALCWDVLFCRNFLFNHVELDGWCVVLCVSPPDETLEQGRNA